MDPPEATKQMLHRAEASARRHGLNLVPGRLNSATGDCAFEFSITMIEQAFQINLFSQLTTTDESR